MSAYAAVVTYAGKVVALEPSTGATLWSKSLTVDAGGDGVRIGVGLDGSVAVADNGIQVTKFAVDGTQLWSVMPKVSSGYYEALHFVGVLPDGNVLIVTHQYARVLAAADGSTLQSVTRVYGEPSTTTQGAASQDRTAFYVASDDHVDAFAYASGTLSLAWSLYLGYGHFPYVDANADRLLVGSSYDGETQVYALSDRSHLWSYALFGDTARFRADGSILVTNNDAVSLIAADGSGHTVVTPSNGLFISDIKSQIMTEVDEPLFARGAEYGIM